MSDDFSKAFLDKIGEALGLTYEQFSADYDRLVSDEEKAARNWWRRYHEFCAWQDAIYREWLTEAVLSICIEDASIVSMIVGYDSQRLLAPPVLSQGVSPPPWHIGRILAACGYRDVMREMADNGEMIVVIDEERHDARIVDLMNVIFNTPRTECLLLSEAAYDRLNDIRSMVGKPVPPPNRDYLRHDPTKQHGRRRRRK